MKEVQHQGVTRCQVCHKVSGVICKVSFVRCQVSVVGFRVAGLICTPHGRRKRE